MESLKAFDKLKGSKPLAFAVVFQRALILAYLQYTRISRQVMDELGEVTEIEIEDEGQTRDGFANVTSVELERAQDLVDALNKVIGKRPTFLRSDCEFPENEAGDSFDRFWLCSLVGPEGPIDFTQGASVRASDLLLLIGLFWKYHTTEGLRRADFESLMDRAHNAASGVDLKLNQCLGRMYVGGASIAARIMRSHDRDETDEDANWGLIRKRAAWLWEAITAKA